jgi:hypothetical protein
VGSYPYSSEMLITTYKTINIHNPDHNEHFHNCKNLKPELLDSFVCLLTEFPSCCAKEIASYFTDIPYFRTMLLSTSEAM